MTGASGILLLPPPSATASTGPGRGREPALAAVVPPQPPGANRRGDARPQDTIAPDRLGSGRRSGRPETSPRQATSAARWLERREPRPAAGRGSPTADGVDSGLPFLAQQIAQEVLSTGLHREPWAAGQAAYRRAGGEPPLPPSGPTLLQLAV